MVTFEESFRPNKSDLPSQGSESEEDPEVQFEIDERAFCKMKNELFGRYAKKYVAVYKQKVVDSDENMRALERRVYKRFGYVPVFVQVVA